MIYVTATITIDENEIEERFIRSSGPGGQNVNKVSSAVQLRFDVANSPSLPEDVRRRLARLAGRRLTRDGVLIIEARRHRNQCEQGDGRKQQEVSSHTHNQPPSSLPLIPIYLCNQEVTCDVTDL